MLDKCTLYAGYFIVPPVTPELVNGIAKINALSYGSVAGFEASLIFWLVTGGKCASCLDLWQSM